MKGVYTAFKQAAAGVGLLLQLAAVDDDEWRVLMSLDL